MQVGWLQMSFLSQRQDQHGAAGEVHPARGNHSGDGKFPLSRPQVAAVVPRSLSQQVHVQSELPGPIAPDRQQRTEGERLCSAQQPRLSLSGSPLSFYSHLSASVLFMWHYSITFFCCSLCFSHLVFPVVFDLWIHVHVFFFFVWFPIVSQTPQHITRNYDKPWLTNSKPSTPSKSSDSFGSPGSSSEVLSCATNDLECFRFITRMKSTAWSSRHRKASKKFVKKWRRGWTDFQT